MVKKTTVILAVLGLLAFGACASWGYTVSQWPVPGIPNATYGPGGAFMPGHYQMNPYQAPMYAPGYHYGMPQMYGPGYHYGPPQYVNPYWGFR